MKLVGKDRLHVFWKRHAAARRAIEAWVAEVEAAQWNDQGDIGQRYPRASFLPDRVVVFRLGGNKYRLEVRVAYQTKAVIVTRIGTHAEYDKWTRSGG